MTSTTTPVCRCPDERTRPYVDVTTPVCARCGNRLDEATARRYHDERRISVPHLFGNPTGIYKRTR